jgi:hypothetical protein
MGRNATIALLCAAVSACAGMAKDRRAAPIETLGPLGLGTPAFRVESGGALTFVNADARPHQIHSGDCAELASTPLQPGQGYTAVLGPGPKLCHFQDLLAPLSASYTGTVEVREAPHIVADDFTGWRQPQDPSREFVSGP